MSNPMTPQSGQNARNRPTQPRAFAAGFTILTPSDGATVLLKNYDPATGQGTLSARVLRTSAAAIAFLCRVDDGPAGNLPPTLPPVLPPGVFALTQDGTTQEFKNDAVTTTVAENQVPNAPDMQVPGRKYVKFASYDNGGNFIEPDSVRICAMPPSILTTVSGKACIWLTFADDGFAFNQAGDYGESTAGGYRPTAIPVPAGSNQVRVQAVAGVWQHHPTPPHQTDAAGRPNAVHPLTRPDIYKSNRPGLNSANITGDVPMPLNALVALADRGPATATAEILVGLDRTLTFSDPQPDKLHLAFHDSFEWSNNHDGAAVPVFGPIQVRVTWMSTVVV